MQLFRFLILAGLLSIAIDDLSVSAGLTSVRFFAISNHSYSVLYRSKLEAGPWSKLADAPARATNRVEVIVDPFFMTKRFYRLVTPTSP